MTNIDIFFLALSLAMDCFTVSIVCGVLIRRWQWSVILRTSLLFGFFQAFMPLLGWLAMRSFAERVEAYGRWIAFGLLLLVGGRMIVESLRQSDEYQPSLHPERLITQLTLAIATSIDALSIGVSMAVIGYDTLHSLCWPLLVIGLASLVLSLVGFYLGIRFGRLSAAWFKPELLGGVVLVAIGLKILLA